MSASKAYHGPLVVPDPDEVARIYRWARADRHPDETTRALRAKCEAALEARPTPKKGTDMNRKLRLAAAVAAAAAVGFAAGVVWAYGS